MESLETLLYEEKNGVAWVTMNRPEAYNAFNSTMQNELAHVWRSLRYNAEVRCVVLTGSGEKAFCTGIDRNEAIGDAYANEEPRPGGMPGFGRDPYTMDDPGEKIGPKSNDLWIPVIAAVNGMACGGAFYMLGEVEFIIAADHATFFDPHVTYGMAAVFEPIHMLQKMPFHEIMRLSLLGVHERMSAERAREIGLVSEVTTKETLIEQTTWAAERIASQPTTAVAGTVRALWMARELSRRQALDMAPSVVRLGTDRQSILDGQQAFASGVRPEHRVR